jgi:hypothetical protein
MTIADQIYALVKTLPPAQAEEILNFAEFIRNKHLNTNQNINNGSFDPETGNFSFLFNPRKQKWKANFIFSEVVIIGLTPEGRTTIKLLQMNSEERLAERRKLRLK